MPQELRWRENTTDECSQEVVKFLSIYSALPGYVNRGLTDLAFLVKWGEVLDTDLELFDIGFSVTDNLISEYNKPKQQTKIKDPFDGV